MESDTTTRPTRKRLPTVALVALLAVLFYVAFGWQGYLVILALIVWGLKEVYELVSQWAFWQFVAFCLFAYGLNILMCRAFGDDWLERFIGAFQTSKPGPPPISDFKERQPYGDANLASKNQVNRALTNKDGNFAPKFED